MTCAEYTELLMTRSWDELDARDAVEHSSTCTRCFELRVIVQRGEAQLSREMASAAASTHPAVLADRAMLGARFRTIERALMIIPVLLIVLMLWLGLRGLPQSTVAFITGRRPLPHLITETIPLRCLSGDQARSLVEPYVSSDRGTVIASGSIPAVTVRGTQEEVQGAKRVIAQFETNANAACRAPHP